MAKFSSIFFPAIVGISVYLVISKFFPEKITYINSQKDLRGGEIVKNNLINKIIKKIMNDRALKIALLSIFATAGIQYFTQEIETLLVDDVFNKMCVKDVDGRLKIVCDIIKEHELNLHSKSIKELIVTSTLSKEDKINLLKIKLDFIINGECAGKKRFLIISILAAVITFCISGVGGLAIFLEALYRLFQEGKISEALYKELAKIVTKKVAKVPVEL
jgi:hypothetical protein